jgi:hypothetical protein
VLQASNYNVVLRTGYAPSDSDLRLIRSATQGKPSFLKKILIGVDAVYPNHVGGNLFDPTNLCNISQK